MKPNTYTILIKSESNDFLRFSSGRPAHADKGKSRVHENTTRTLGDVREHQRDTGEGQMRTYERNARGYTKVTYEDTRKVHMHAQESCTCEHTHKNM